MKKILLLLTVVCLAMFSSCVDKLEDEGIYSQVTIKGKVLEEGKNIPLQNIAVKVTNGTQSSKFAYTDKSGNFSIAITNKQISENYYLQFSFDSLYSAKDVKIEGISYGKKEFLIGDIYMQGAGVPAITTLGVSDISFTTVKTGGNVTDNGRSAVTTKGICYSTLPHPTIKDACTNDGSGAGAFVTVLENLDPDVTYYIRAYAVNNAGVGYGEQITFKTKSALSTVNLDTLYDITTTSVVCYGSITEDNGFAATEKGFCWSVKSDPTVENTHVSSDNNSYGFSETISGLAPNTKYYIRAYARNISGIAYSEQKSFTTLSGKATITTKEVSDITYKSAVCGGNVSDDGGFKVIERGVCYSVQQNPTVADMHTIDGDGTGSFTSNLVNLQSKTTYYVRAYCKNSLGVFYGEQISFKTE